MKKVKCACGEMSVGVGRYETVRRRTPKQRTHSSVACSDNERTVIQHVSKWSINTGGQK